jgi:hypothetical protein
MARRALFEPGINAEAQASAVDSHLAGMGEAKVSDSDWARVRKIVKNEHTPDVVKAFKVDAAVSTIPTSSTS